MDSRSTLEEFMLCEQLMQIKYCISQVKNPLKKAKRACKTNVFKSLTFLSAEQMQAFYLWEEQQDCRSFKQLSCQLKAIIALFSLNLISLPLSCAKWSIWVDCLCELWKQSQSYACVQPIFYYNERKPSFSCITTKLVAISNGSLAH